MNFVVARPSPIRQYCFGPVELGHLGMRKKALIWVSFVVLGALGCGGGGGGGGFNGVPAQMIPNLRSAKATDLAISNEDIGSGSNQKILRLSSIVENWGEGPMEIFGNIQGANQTLPVPATQRIIWNNGDVTSIPAGDFEYHDVHNHWHWENLISFKLAQAVNGVDPYDAANTVVASSNKVSFCLLDTAKIAGYSGTNQPGSRRYQSCGQNKQGISPGWYDIYVSSLYGQWIVIDGVSDGVYWVILEADPTNLLTETNETDNRSAVKVQITGNSVTVIP